MIVPLYSQMTNQEISVVFSFISQVLGMDTSNRFRSRAYEEASVVVSHLDYQLKDLFQKDKNEFMEKVDALPGIGEAITSKLAELFETGDIKAFQKLVKDLPGGMYPLMQIHGIGAKKAYKLAEQFKLDDPETAVDLLLTKAKHGQVQGLTGFGKKSEEQLITALEEQHHKARIPHAKALKVAGEIEKTLKKCPQVKEVVFLGSLRRGSPTVGDIDLGMAASDSKKVVSFVLDHLASLKRVLVAGENLLSIIVTNNWQADIKFAPLSEWGSFIQHFTGDKQHNIALREYALKKGLSLSEHGIKIKKTGEVKKFASEEKFYNYLGLKLIPPAERVGGEEIEQYQVK